MTIPPPLRRYVIFGWPPMCSMVTKGLYVNNVNNRSLFRSLKLTNTSRKLVCQLQYEHRVRTAWKNLKNSILFTVCLETSGNVWKRLEFWEKCCCVWKSLEKSKGLHWIFIFGMFLSVCLIAIWGQHISKFSPTNGGQFKCIYSHLRPTYFKKFSNQWWTI